METARVGTLVVGAAIMTGTARGLLAGVAVLNLNVGGSGEGEVASLHRRGKGVGVNHGGAELTAIPEDDSIAGEVRANNLHREIAGADRDGLREDLADIWYQLMVGRSTAAEGKKEE